MTISVMYLCWSFNVMPAFYSVYWWFIFLFFFIIWGEESKFSVWKIVLFDILQCVIMININIFQHNGCEKRFCAQSAKYFILQLVFSTYLCNKSIFSCLKQFFMQIIISLWIFVKILINFITKFMNSLRFLHQLLLIFCNLSF